MPRFYFFLFAVLVTSSLVACEPTSHGPAAAVLDDVEMRVNEQSDSALVLLQRINTADLTSRALRARYSLLYTMALDKSYQDITVPGLLDPAVQYYEHHGTPDERMKTLHYQGRIAQEKGDPNMAAVFYSRAEAYAEGVMDKHALGLLYLAKASVYNTAFNTKKEKAYIEKALDVFQATGDASYAQTLGQLAGIYFVQREWALADSLYREGISAAACNRNAMASYLSNYARMKVLQPCPDPAGAVELLNRKQKEYGFPLSLRDAGAYAYALTLSGRKRDAQGLLEQLQQRAELSPTEAWRWICRCAVVNGDFRLAYEALNRSSVDEENKIQGILSDSVSEAISTYQEMTAKQKRLQYQVGILLLSSILLLLILALVLVNSRKNKFKEEKNRVQGICTILEEEVAEHGAQTADLQQQLMHFREIARQERVLRFRQAGRMRSSIWRLDQLGLPAWFKKDQSLTAIKEELSYVYDIDDSGEKLLQRMDRELGGVITPLLEKLDIKNNKQDQLLLAYCLLDLPSDLVGAKLEITPNNVRVRKHRLKEQIAKLNDSDLDSLFGIRR